MEGFEDNWGQRTWSIVLIIHRNGKPLLSQVSQLQRVSLFSSSLWIRFFFFFKQTKKTNNTPLTKTSSTFLDLSQISACVSSALGERPMQSGEGFSGGMRLRRSTHSHLKKTTSLVKRVCLRLTQWLSTPLGFFFFFILQECRPAGWHECESLSWNLELLFY